MSKFYWTIIITLLYMETVYHIAVAGLRGINPLFLLPVLFFIAGIETVFLSFSKKTINKGSLWCIQIANFLIYSSQIIYMRIFTQPLLAAAVVNAGGTALKNYWRELLYAIGQNIVVLLILAVPLILTRILLHKSKDFINSQKTVSIKRTHAECRIWGTASAVVGLLVWCMAIFFGWQFRLNYYEDYQSFYDPKYAVEEYGVLASIQRDILGDDVLPEVRTEEIVVSADSNAVVGKPKNAEVAEEVRADDGTNTADGGAGEEAENGIAPQVLNIDMNKLQELATDEEVGKLVSFMASREPTTTNEYTGMFEGYNLIYLTAEGFSPYVISKELTPTLYKLSHEGFVAENYYVPLWQTSTSDGEYVNLTGQIPYRQFSMKASANNVQPYSLPAYFATEGAKSYAYHNNYLDYYDRNLSHPNLGYDFKASKLGDLSEDEWGSYIFQMENADYWPASDLDMMRATVPEYIGEDQFHVYYMTVSGHLNYNFTGNRMSSKNREYVADLPYSDEGKAYIACNIELDRALEYLIAELDKAGKLDNTVIVLSADHYPYGMNLKHYEELAGQELSDSLEIYRNTLILWNAGMEEPVLIEKPCGAMDIIPTLYNLFGFTYDSRFFPGTDMLSDSEGLVIFSDRSFITDSVSYNKDTGEVLSRNGEEVNTEYVDQTKQKVKQLYEYSNGILQHNYFYYVDQAVVK